MTKFESKLARHALQPDEKIDLSFRMLIRIMERDYSKELEELEIQWEEER